MTIGTGGESLPRPIRRRWRAITLVVPVSVVISCGVGQPDTEELPPPVCAAGQIDGDVVLLSRPDELSPTVIDQFEERYGVDVVERSYESEDDMLSRITAGADAFDIVLLADYLAETLWRAERLFPLDPIALPGRVNLDPMFVRSSGDADLVYSVPMVWGTVGIGLNVNAVGEDYEPSWGLVFDTYRAWPYAGRVSLLDDARQVLAAAMLYLGDSPNLVDRAPVQAAAEVVMAARSHLGEFDSGGYAVKLVEGVVDVAHGRSDAFVEAIPPDTTDFHYVIPEEGAVVWVDSMVVPTTSTHPCSAHSFIDFVLEPKIGAEVATYAGVATPNQAALEYVPSQLKTNPGIYPLPEVRARLELLVYSEELERLSAEEFIHLKPS